MRDATESERLARIEAQLETLVAVSEKTSEAVRQLAVVEVQQREDGKALSRAFDAIEKHGQRIAKLEQEQPLQKLAANWVFGAVLFVMSLLGAAAIGVLWKGIGT